MTHSISLRLVPGSIALLVSILSYNLVTASDQIAYFGYNNAIELKNEDTRVVLCPEVGGRILEYSLRGKNVLHLSDADKSWKPGMPPQSSAGRFDIGPELVIPRRSVLWTGKWLGEITGPRSARLTSQEDSATGVKLIRDFSLDERSSRLLCTQTIVNVSQATKEWCHWSRTFAVGKGICIVPLSDPQSGPMSRFPSSYVMYESRGLINMQPDDPQIRRVGNSLHIYPTPKHPKLGFDSYAGTLAYLAPNDLMFVKKFKTFPNRVYNEAAGLTISVWYPDREMIELEPIGPRQRIAPGESASFTEEWWLEELPFPGVDKPVDSADLQQRLDRMK